MPSCSSRQMPLWLVSAVLACSGSAGAATSILFDATKAQTAGNADWVVDADTYNLGADSTTHLMVVGGGNEANPAATPTPAQSGITDSTSETYWKGALSSWGVDAAQRGYTVKTLPYNGRITYGDSNNAQDLSNYKVYVVDEPNILFTAAEKTAILNFVSNGGGLMMISDHSGSDRNNDNNDSVDVWNGLLGATAAASPFGISFNADDVNVTTASVDSVTTDPITRGAAGAVTNLKYNDGATISISTAGNASVQGAVWQTSPRTNTNLMAAYASYGLGRVVAVGDSSPADDGTGDANDTLFDGWHSGTNGVLFENATLWLSGSTTASAPVPEPAILGTIGVAGVMLLRRREDR